MIISKKLNLFLLLALVGQQVGAADVEPHGITSTRSIGGINYIQGAAGFLGTYLYLTTLQVFSYAYLVREANIQKTNPTINHDVIDTLKSKCLDKGVVIDHVYYNPNMPLAGNAAVMPSPLGTLLLLGSGYGASINEKDVVPLSEEKVNFIMGRECGHVLHGDIFKRKLIIASMAGVSFSDVKDEVFFGSVPFFFLGLAKYFRHQEYNADYYASTDPKVVKAGSQFFKDLHAKGQYNHLFARIGSAFDHMFLGTHPCSAKRSAQLELRARELQKAKQVF